MNNFPVNIKKSKPSLEEIFLREARPRTYGLSYAGNSPVAQTNMGTLIENFNGNSNRVIDFESYLSSTASIIVNYSNGFDDSSFVANTFVQFYLNPGSEKVIKIKSLIGPPTFSMNTNLGDGITPVKVGALSSYKLITNDCAFDSDRTIGWVGDSISLPTTNSDLTKFNYHHFSVKYWLQKFSPAKETFRLTITAEGGKTSSGWVSLLNKGGAGSSPCDLSIDFYQMGMNDSGQSIGTALYKTNIKKWLTHRKENYPGIVLVLLGTTPAQNTTRNTNLNAYRTAMAECVLEEKAIYTAEGLNPEKIIGIDLSNSFDRTVSARFATSDGVGGDALHPGDITANFQMFNKICEGVDYNTADGSLGVNFGGLLPAGGLRQRNIFDLLK